MTEQAKRNNAGKPALSRVFLFDLSYLADHMAAGEAKYPNDEDGTPNWRKGNKPDAEYTNAAARHLAAFVNGEELDPELGTHHLAAVVWNCLALLTCNRSSTTKQPGVFKTGDRIIYNDDLTSPHTRTVTHVEGDTVYYTCPAADPDFVFDAKIGQVSHA